MGSNPPSGSTDDQTLVLAVLKPSAKIAGPWVAATWSLATPPLADFADGRLQDLGAQAETYAPLRRQTMEEGHETGPHLGDAGPTVPVLGSEAGFGRSHCPDSVLTFRRHAATVWT